MESDCEQETSFRGGGSIGIRVLKDRVEGLYSYLSKSNDLVKLENPTFYFYDYKIRDRHLYYKDKTKPLTKEDRTLKIS